LGFVGGCRPPKEEKNKTSEKHEKDESREGLIPLDHV